MDPLEAVYAAVARGESRPPSDYNEYKRMLAMARRAMRADDAQARLDAVVVCGAIGGFRGMDLVRQFLRDPDEAVRRACLEAAVAGGEDGLPVLRDALSSSDDAVAMEAIGWLERAMDKSAVSKVRAWLKHDKAARRAAALRLIGQVGGAGMVIAVGKLTADEDDEVKAAANEAIERLEGRLPRAEPRPWWGGESLETPVEAWSPPPRLPLPLPLPGEPVALLQLLARVAEADRAAVLTALAALPSSAVGREARRAGPGNTDVDFCTGVALFLALTERKDLVVTVRRMLPHGDAGVRIVVARALAVASVASVVGGVRDLLLAPEPEVRVAGVQSLAQLVSGKELAGYLAVLDGEEDESVLAAVQAARG